MPCGERQHRRDLPGFSQRMRRLSQAQAIIPLAHDYSVKRNHSSPWPECPCRSGVVLCGLANAIVPGTVRKVCS